MILPRSIVRVPISASSTDLTEVFYVDDHQKEITEKLIEILKDKGFEVATRVTKAGTFWDAEDYHQDYYEKKNGTPYCHSYQKRF
jgi:peptide methionine sulfoxide reductase msrA/msrB